MIIKEKTNKEFDEKEWLENIRFIVGDMDKERYVALFVLIEDKIRYELSQQKLNRNNG